jgi:hypothetical protein
LADRKYLVPDRKPRLEAALGLPEI